MGTWHETFTWKGQEAPGCLPSTPDEEICRAVLWGILSVHRTLAELQHGAHRIHNAPVFTQNKSTQAHCPVQSVWFLGLHPTGWVQTHRNICSHSLVSPYIQASSHQKAPKYRVCGVRHSSSPTALSSVRDCKFTCAEFGFLVHIWETLITSWCAWS